MLDKLLCSIHAWIVPVAHCLGVVAWLHSQPFAWPQVRASFFVARPSDAIPSAPAMGTLCVLFADGQLLLGFRWWVEYEHQHPHRAS